MYILQAGSGMTSFEFIRLEFEDKYDPNSVNVDINEVNIAAALVWYGFLLGRFGREQELGIARDPEIVWREPIDLSVLEPVKPQEDKPKEKEGVQA